MIKKVVIAAAGRSTRMLQLALNKSKHLINIKKKPFIFYLLDNIFKAGYKEIILVIGYKAEKFKEILRNYRLPAKGCKIQFVNQFEILGKEKYGTACPLMCVEDIVGKENFLMVAGGDFYLPETLKKFRTLDDKYNYLAGYYHKQPQKYGVLSLDKKGFLKKIVEKPQKPIGNIINISLYRFTPEIFDKVKKIKKSKRGEYEVTDAASLLAKEKKVKVIMVSNYWLDFGNPTDIIKLSKFLKDNNQK